MRISDWSSDVCSSDLDKPGLFQAADGGTLFLDEVAELPLSMQVKLLRAIQEKNIRPVGASIEVPVDVRILSATHKDLSTLVNEGRFRHDLYYRINVIELDVPPLHERTGDLPLLADAILMRLAHAMKRSTPKLSADALAALEVYPFPGNVRELENILERALALADGDAIHAEDLRLPAQQSVTPEAVASAFVSANAATASNPATPTTPPDPRTPPPPDTHSHPLPLINEKIPHAHTPQPQ